MAGPQLPDIVQITALTFGLIWTALNFYNFYPLVQTAVERSLARLRGGSETPPSRDSDSYPEIDVFVAAYEEAGVIENALSSIHAADYPRDRLAVYLITEPGDEATRAAAADLPYEFHDLVIPEEYPGDPNKPRALNYAYEHSDGEVIGIIDAEDLIAPGLFEEVARAYLDDDADYMQGRPDMVNEDDGWLNLLFRAEYGYWYNLIVPARAQVHYPVPLSGNTCFFERPILEDISKRRIDRHGDPWSDEEWAWVRERGLSGIRPWDPRNVTEDFELGLRLWATGADFSYLSSITREESPPSLDGWISQRTRWKKGKLFTAQRFFDYPPEGIRPKLHLYWQSLLPHLGPINIMGVVIVLMIGTLSAYRPDVLVAPVLALGATFAIVVSLLFSVGYLITSDRSRTARVRGAIIVAGSVWLYWFLQWGADLRALVQTYAGDLSWEHTDHFGLHEGERQGTPAYRRLINDYTLTFRQRTAFLTVIVLVGTALRIHGLGGWSLWLDEVYTVADRGALPMAELLVRPSDPHPPLYYLLMHGWLEAVGRSEFLVRLPSTVASVATIPVVYRLGTRLYDDRIGLLAAGILAVTPFHVHFARVARMYALFGLLTAVSWYFLFSLSRSDLGALIGYVLATAAMVYVHVFAVFVVASQFAVLALLAEPLPVSKRRIAGAVGAVGALSLPWMALLGYRVSRLVLGSGGANIEWIPEPSSIAIARTVLSFAGFPDYYPILAGSSIIYIIASLSVFAYAALVLASVFRYGPDDGYELDVTWYTGATGAWFVLPIAIPFLISQAVPIYAPRYTIPASLPLYLLVARGVSAVPTRRAKQLLIGILLVGASVNTGAYLTTDTAEDWSGVTERIELRADPSDLIVMQPGYIAESFGYYYTGPELERVRVRGARGVTPAEYRTVRRAAGRHDRVWLVTYFGATERTRAMIAANHTLVAETEFGSITVYRYERVVDRVRSAADAPAVYDRGAPRRDR